MKGEERLSLVLPPKRERKRKERGGASADYPPDPLFDALRALRRDLARAAGVPPYVIFLDASLREMAALRPETAGGLAQISGVSAKKLENYGDAFLAVLRDHAG
jgi:ATP-dependent DNA helicase RecQ